MYSSSFSSLFLRPTKVSLKSLPIFNYLEYAPFSLEAGYNSNYNNRSPSIIAMSLNGILFPKYPLNPSKGNSVYIELRN